MLCETPRGVSSGLPWLAAMAISGFLAFVTSMALTNAVPTITPAGGSVATVTSQQVESSIVYLGGSCWSANPGAHEACTSETGPADR
jgi:hypothetical protein